MPAQKSTSGVATKKKVTAAPAAADLPKPVAAETAPPAAETAPPAADVAADAPKPTAEGGDAKPAAAAVQNPVTAFVARLQGYVERVSGLHKDMKEMVTEGRGLEKEYASIVKLMSKKTKFVKNTEDRPLSGFAMPSLLSNELYEFLGIEKGKKVPRKDVTKMMNEYIKTNELRDEADKRTIRPNPALHKIFRSTDNDEISYFNLQKFMKHHFVKESDLAATPVAAGA